MLQGYKEFQGLNLLQNVALHHKNFKSKMELFSLNETAI